MKKGNMIQDPKRKEVRGDMPSGTQPVIKLQNQKTTKTKKTPGGERATPMEPQP